MRAGVRVYIENTHMDYQFPIGNENLLSLQRYAYFILLCDLLISIHYDRYRPLLDNCEDEIIRISLYNRRVCEAFNLFQIQ